MHYHGRKSRQKGRFLETYRQRRQAVGNVVVDGFTKFVWLYPTKSTDTRAVIDSLEKQASIFGNPVRIITDRGTAFISQAFEDYCNENKIQYLLIATGVPRGNGQVERMHRL